MIKNVYIHIPFCKQKCHYCSFTSFTCINNITQYVETLCHEIKQRYQKEELNTLYIGGGTPSLLQIEYIKKIKNLFNTNKSTEITLEINPETINKEYLQELYNIGINRISLGCQTFNDKILNKIGRKHSPTQVIDCVKNAINIGFNNINLDFIYGLPEQTIKDFEEDLKKGIDLGITHISLYGLKIDPDCYFYNHMPNNLPDNDTQADMYIKAIEIMSENNFNHYEISNFALNGFESKHNLNYWNNNTYYGFGVAAHGYQNNTRYSNQVNLETYLKNPLCHEDEIELTKQEQLEEEIFLGFRKMSGIDKNLINKKYNIDFDNRYKDIINKYKSSGHIICTNNGYKLSTEGILVSNNILADFLE